MCIKLLPYNTLWGGSAAAGMTVIYVDVEWSVHTLYQHGMDMDMDMVIGPFMLPGGGGSKRTRNPPLDARGLHQVLGRSDPL